MTTQRTVPDSSVAFLVTGSLGPNWRAEMTEIIGASALVGTTAEEALAHKEAVRYVLAWRTEPGLLAHFPNLKAIFSVGAGVDHLMRDPTLPDVPIIRYVEPDMTRRMGEWVILQVLTHHRKALTYLAHQRRAQWQVENQPAPHEIAVGVMGLGELGSHCCGLLNAIGFEVLGWSRTQKSIAGVTCYAGSGDFDAFLSNTNILVSLLPHTPQTEGLINRDLLAKLGRNRQHGAYVINAGRGKLQVETDLIAALEEGTLSGASLDVFEAEPLTAESPLWGMENVVITPHVAAISAPITLAQTVRAGICTFEAGGLPDHIVDRERGY